ncbi:MAG TPA: adenylate/guanylate cyclase domain-containing protein [Actinomycetota bacterium]|nr:adenylate/guanylate cyclase domain-containing protein [Actinomycetota bacterium]
MARIEVLRPVVDGRFRPGDAFRARMVQALLDSGFTAEQVEGAVAGGMLDLDHVDRFPLVQPGRRSDRTFEEFLRRAGPRAARVLPAVYAVMGLPQPDPAAPIREDEEALLAQFLEAWSLAGDEALIRAARLLGEGTRMAAFGWPDLFSEQVAAAARERWLQGEVERYPPEVIRTGTLLASLLPRLMTWLNQRFLEQRIVAGIVDNFEDVLAARGLAPSPEPSAPPAVVFADLSDYTRATEERGDETAVHLAATLQERAERVAAAREGRLVKLLGDGAMLHFRDAARGVEGALELVAAVTEALGLPTHAGVHAGPVIERDRDLFGRTVNLASRIAGRAGPGEVLVSELAARAAAGSGISLEDLGTVAVKGVAEPLRLYRATR